MLDYDQIFKKLIRNGSDYAEIYHERTTSTVIKKEAGRFEQLETGTDEGLGLRLIKNLQTFYSFTNNIDQKSIETLAEDLSNSTEKNIWKEREIIIPDIVEQRHKVKIHPGEKSINQKIAIVERAESCAKNYDKKIVSVNITYLETEKEITIYNNRNSPLKERRIYTSFFVHVVANNGKSFETGYEVVGGLTGFELFESNPPEEIAKRAVIQALALLNAPYAPAHRMTVVLGSEAGGTMIHEAVGHGLEADHIQDRVSVYAGRIGEKVALPLITVVDDPTIPNKRGSYTFDDEGVPAQKKILIEKGILKDFMYDVLTGIKDGRTSNGNGRRESYRHIPIPRMSNTLIAPGAHNPEDIIRSVDKGLYVKKMGGGEVNTLTGDFVFHVLEGYLIDKGSICEIVKGATITGNGPEILKSIDMVGNDLGFGIGTCGKEEQGVPVADAQPTIRVPEMIVGGLEL